MFKIILKLWICDLLSISLEFFYSKIWGVIVDIEGADYHIDPNDPGGATKYGISQRSYPGRNIESLTSSDAFQIFKNDFFLKVKADWWVNKGYPAFALLLSAFAFHAGTNNAVKCLQAVINNYHNSVSLLVDGDLGPKTSAAIENFTEDQEDIVMIILYPDLIAQILSYYKDLYIFKMEGKGYINRLIKIIRAFPRNNIQNAK